MAIASNFPAIRPSLNLDFANAKVLDPRITFSRASAATYYDGKTVAKAEENLLTYSQEFASWGVSGTGQCSVTSDVAVAPDGTMTADLLLPNTSTAGYRARSSANTVATSAGSILSFYVKPAGYNFVSIVLTSNFSRSTIDVTSGAITNYGANALSVVSTTLVGDWYRVVLSVPTSITASALWLGPNSVQRDPLIAWAGDGTSGIYIWGAQLEQRSQVTAYTPTTTQPITNYIPVLQTALSGVPRIDHDPITGECKGLLIEEQRTNLLTYSEQFDNAAWAKSLVTIQPNGTVAPDGTQTADKLVPGTGTATYISSTAIGKTLSVYAKASGKSTLLLYSGVTGSNAYFNLTTGAVGTKLSDVTSTSIVSIGNGWYRCSVTWITDSTAVRIYAVDSDGSLSATGDGYSGIYIWGAQMEAGSFPTSYIKTEASQVTRATDAASMTGANFSSWYRQDEGTLCGEASTSAFDSSRVIAEINDNSVANRIFIARSSATNSSLGNVTANGATQAGASIVSAFTAGNIGKTAIAYKVDNFAHTANGANPVLDVSGLVPTTVNRLNIGNVVGQAYWCGHIKRISYYPKRLTDAQLQALTA